MIIECPQCSAKNAVIGELLPGKTYRCGSYNSVITILQTDDVAATKSDERKVETIAPASPEVKDIVSDKKTVYPYRNPTIRELANDLTAKGAFNDKETHLNPTLEDAINKDKWTTPVQAETDKNDSNTSEKNVSTILDNPREEKIQCYRDVIA